MKHEHEHEHKDHRHDSALRAKINDQLGQDFDAATITEVEEHMSECPDCRIYVDSVKQTIKIYRVTESNTSVPTDVSDRLFKVLKLGKK